MAFQKTCSNILVIILFLKTVHGFDLNSYCKDRCMRGSGGVLCQCSAIHFSGKRSSASGDSMVSGNRNNGVLTPSRAWQFGNGVGGRQHQEQQRKHGILPAAISDDAEGLRRREMVNNNFPTSRLMDEYKENNGLDLGRNPAGLGRRPASPAGPAFWKANRQSLSKGASSLLRDSVRMPGGSSRLYLYRKEASEDGAPGKQGDEDSDERRSSRDHSSGGRYAESHSRDHSGSPSKVARWRNIRRLIQGVRVKLEQNARNRDKAAPSTFGYSEDSGTGYELPLVLVDNLRLAPDNDGHGTDLEDFSASAFPSTVFTTPIPTANDVLGVTSPADRHLSALRRVLSNVIERRLALPQRSVRSVPSRHPSKVKVTT